MNPLLLLGVGISHIGTFITFVRKFPIVWKLFKHREEIKKILENTWSVFQSTRANGGIPSCEDTKKILQNIAIIFEKDLIDLPELDELQFADQIRELDALIVCRVDYKPEVKNG